MALRESDIVPGHTTHLEIDPASILGEKRRQRNWHQNTGIKPGTEMRWRHACVLLLPTAAIAITRLVVVVTTIMITAIMMLQAS